jgi:hypothetical protein
MSNFREHQFHALGCIRCHPSLFIRDSWLFATLPSMQHWVAEVAGLADDRKIRELLRRFLGRRAVRVVGVVALLVVVVVLLFLILNWYVAPNGATQKQALVVTLAQILSGTALLSGLYFTWRTLQVNREGQITERYTRAIDQLGKVEDGRKLFEIRVGGIYALERIARDSPKRDYSTVMEVSLQPTFGRTLLKLLGPPTGPLRWLRSTAKPLPKQMKVRSSRLRRSYHVLLLTSRRFWMCSNVRRLGYPRNTVLASIFMKPTSKEPTSKMPTSKMPTSTEPTSKVPTS